MHPFPYSIVDLTHTLDEHIPTWDGSCGFDQKLAHDYDPKVIYPFRTHKMKMNAGIGTHMDAPAHCIPGGITIDEFPLSHLITPCVKLDVSEFADEHYRVSVQEIENFEKEYGLIDAGSLVLIRTGWERFWHTPEKYHNQHLFPSVSREAAEFLLTRGIAGIGIDTLSPDRPEDGFPVHQLLLGAGKYIVENAAHLVHLPPRGSFILTMPIKMKGGTEAPIRLVGLISESA